MINVYVLHYARRFPIGVVWSVHFAPKELTVNRPSQNTDISHRKHIGTTSIERLLAVIIIALIMAHAELRLT